jgi:hypothetical protein
MEKVHKLNNSECKPSSESFSIYSMCQFSRNIICCVTQSTHRVYTYHLSKDVLFALIRDKPYIFYVVYKRFTKWAIYTRKQLECSHEQNSNYEAWT